MSAPPAHRRRLFLDRGIGESRAVVTLDGQPERLIIRRDSDPASTLLGARSVARIGRVHRAVNAAYLVLEGGGEAFLQLGPELPKFAEGQMIDIEIRGEPRRGKSAIARFLGMGEGSPRLLQAAPSLEEELAHFGGEGTKIVEGLGARETADEAESEILEPVHDLPGGGTIAIEPTRALTAIDVDLGDRPGGDAKRATRAANLAALTEAARLLRLKGLGGLIVFDLAGRGHDGAALLAAARIAFGPDNPGVAIGAISRFGTMELTVPRRRAPVLDLLRGPDGGLSALAGAQRLARALEREGRAAPGSRLEAACSPAVAEAFNLLSAGLADRLGARFSVTARAGMTNGKLEVAAR
ncbi:MAG: RNA-binding protein [Caulobacter sp.]|nr:RNA-binding protein [Caulobacter sp.]